MIVPSQHGKFLTGRALYVHHNMGNSLLVEQNNNIRMYHHNMGNSLLVEHLYVPSQHGKFLTGRAVYDVPSQHGKFLTGSAFTCTITTWEVL